MITTDSPRGVFSIGADVSRFVSISESNTVFAEESTAIYYAAENASKLVVAAIDGMCFDGALSLVLCFAERFCTPRSMFGLLN